MKNYIWLLLLPLLATPVTASQLPTTFHNEQLARKERVKASIARDQCDPSLMYFYVKHINDHGSAEQTTLKLYLKALQDAMWTTDWMLRKKGLTNYFCLPPSENLYFDASPYFLQDIVNEVYLKEPHIFEKNGIYKSIESVVAYGLQYKYPCDRHFVNMPGFN